MLFQADHVQPILSGRKTQTRRLWPKGRRAVPGSLHWATTKLYDPTARFALLRILRVWQEPLLFICYVDARAEGYEGSDAYIAAFLRINRLKPEIASTITVWAVEFAVVS